MSNAKIIIAGGRDFDDYNYMKKSVDEVIGHLTYKNIIDKIEIVSGMAEGADFLGIKYAFDKGYNIHPCEPKFWEHGTLAGEMRNKTMAEYASDSDFPCLCIFWNGKSKGSKHMIETAGEYHIPTHIFPY